MLAFASLDGIAGFHETFNTLFTMSWTLPFGLLAFVVAACFLPFLRRLPARSRNGIVVAGAIYLAGAIGMELIASRLFDHVNSNKHQFSYALMTMVEEGLEMFGVWILIHTLLAYMSTFGITLAVLRDTRVSTPQPRRAGLRERTVEAASGPPTRRRLPPRRAARI